ncbi:glutaminase [Halarcobacter bivalviorum]|uniref:Glutaminase n=1 Tax=Halarcobacter bivalviorum TaxID=663364 RepID=A0AAX2A8B2_9BACT|nr:glutaminase [Halarcobacter bivalviorum]AXH13614.1 glutaminase A [Halarcobacter bivalviorum]RXK09781.1 glutaminase [Halarcobacter bivalviorum]
MNYQKILEEIKEQIQTELPKGEVASYIPALKNVQANDFAMSIKLLDGTSYNIGCFDKKFSIQSISKVFTFSMALKHYGKELYQRVWYEPSGNPFNSLVQLEYEKGIPRNPFINAGAIVTTDSLLSYYKDKNLTFNEINQFINNLSKKEISFDEEIFKSELESGYRNQALASLMKSFNNIDNPIEETLETYFKHCSLMMSCEELASAMLFLANHGVDPLTNEEFITAPKAKRVNALMLTCGHYDASGDFAFHVGLPGKSGVGGGIVAIVPKKMAICVYSPRLNEKGNSHSGTKALELFTTLTDLSIF